MKYRYMVGLFIAAFILQTTLMNAISIMGVTPNLLLCLVVMLSFLYDEQNYGIVLGVIFGLLHDLCFSQYVGVAAAAFFIISLAIMLVNIVMNKESVFSVILISISSTVLYTIIYWAITRMLGSNYNLLYVARSIPLYVLYNTAVMILLYYLMIKRVVKHHNDRYYK